MTEFETAYITAALWSSTDNSREDGGDPMDDNYCPEDISPETLAKMKADCAAFQRQFAVALRQISDSQAGHDFWLTRNGHGAGFWDRGMGKIGDMLSDGAKAYGEFNLYVGDNGQIDGD